VTLPELLGADAGDKAGDASADAGRPPAAKTGPESADSAGDDLPLVPTPRAPPTRLVIPSISVDAPVVPVPRERVEVSGTPLEMPGVPTDGAAGWDEASASLEAAGNTVIIGHNTGNGEVFRDLYSLEEGEEIVLYSGETRYPFTVSQVLILREAGQSLATRRRNARHIEPTDDDRLTLVTCHPYGSLRYRLIVVARPGISGGGWGPRQKAGLD
jgi:LPXTG-site transpeptidase (sortase) family protein